MAMTLRLDAADEAVLREVAERTHRTLADAIVLSVRHYRDVLVVQEEAAELAARTARRTAHRRAIDESISRNVELVERLSR